MEYKNDQKLFQRGKPDIRQILQDAYGRIGAQGRPAFLSSENAKADSDLDDKLNTKLYKVI